jgi:hypothetical protein
MGAGQEWIERFPRPGETCVFSQSGEMWRRDALMFDRVYAPLIGSSLSPAHREPPDIPLEISFSSWKVDEHVEWTRGTLSHWMENIGSVPPDFDFEEADKQYMIRSEQELEAQYSYEGVMGTWCASERGIFLKRFSAGETAAYQGALNNLPIVTSDISWEEVRAFRRDPEALRKYRDLRLWLSEGLRASSEQHATDLIAQRIEDYRWAIKKHGLRTIVGAVSNLWDWKQSLALAAGVGAAATVGSVAMAALVGGLAITSGIGAYFAERRISEKDTRRGAGREVAILVDIQDRFGTTHA